MGIIAKIRQALRQRGAGHPVDTGWDDLQAADLCLPICLDEQVVFDALAVLENGFYLTSSTRILTTQAEGRSSGGDAKASVGTVATVGVSFSGSLSGDKRASREAETTMEKVHTPASLFAKLRLMLARRGVVKTLASEEDVGALSPGDFVEFVAVLRKNPLVHTLEALKGLLEFSRSVADGPVPAHGGGGRKAKRRTERTGADAAEVIIGSVLGAVQAAGTLEVIGEIRDGSTRVTLPCKLDCFIGQTTSRLIDGEFHVFGKVARVVHAESDEPINLLRNTPFGALSEPMVKQLTSVFEGLDEAGITLPPLVTEIRGPATQVLPVAIFA